MWEKKILEMICSWAFFYPKRGLEKVLRREGDVLRLCFVAGDFYECPVCSFVAGERYKVKDFVGFIALLRQLFGVRVVRIHYPEYQPGKYRRLAVTEENMDEGWLALDAPCETLLCFEGVEWQAEPLPKKSGIMSPSV